MTTLPVLLIWIWRFFFLNTSYFSNTGGGSGTTSDSKNIKKEFEEGRKKLEELVNKVEGCSQIIENLERCLMHDGDLVEIDITENTAIHRVHGYLTNDGFMVNMNMKKII